MNLGFDNLEKNTIFASELRTTKQSREMAERSNAAVLKTVDCQRSGGSNPSLSAESPSRIPRRAFFLKIARI